MQKCTEAIPEVPEEAALSKSLSKVLGQSEHVKNLVEECADELTEVNNALKDEVAATSDQPEMAQALQKSEAVEVKAQEAAEKLSAVNMSLEEEVDARHQLELRLTEVTAEKDANRHAALHDALTGLPNRSLFDDRLEHGVAQAKRHGRALAVMFIDLDGFKRINDIHGHDAGDAVLLIVADRLRESIRDDDTVSRHGGDEFLCLLMEMGDDQDIVAIAGKIAAAIQLPLHLPKADVVVKSSIGIAIFPRPGAEATDLIKDADAAMYVAKRAGSGYAFAP
jgi:diguanylate cyclase (GGDEF)-like protein